MNHLFYNPKANNGEAYKDLDMIKRTLDGQTVREYNLLEFDDYTDLLEQIRPEDVVYIVGGDGTLNRFINNSRNLSIFGDIYFYSAGTSNDFKHDVDPDGKLYRIRLNDYIANLPVVTVKGKDYKFINGIGFGIDGYCCEEGDRIHAAGKGPVNYTGIAVKGCLLKFKPCNATITVDGVSRKYKNVWLAPAMLGKYYGGGMKVAPNQERGNPEHLLSSVVMYGTGRLKTLIRFPKIFSGEHIRYKDMVEIYQGHEIKVQFDRPCALQVDGETIPDVTEYTARYE